jgi:hypothetical protein
MLLLKTSQNIVASVLHPARISLPPFMFTTACSSKLGSKGVDLFIRQRQMTRQKRVCVCVCVCVCADQLLTTALEFCDKYGLPDEVSFFPFFSFFLFSFFFFFAPLFFLGLLFLRILLISCPHRIVLYVRPCGVPKP